MNETLQVVMLILAAVGAITLVIVGITALVWPFYTLSGIDTCQNDMIEDVEKIKKKLNIKDD